MKTYKYHVTTADGTPCVLDGLKFHAQGLLRPAKADETATDFGERYSKGRYRAMQAIARTKKFVTDWNSVPNMLSDWEDAKKFVSQYAFKVASSPSATKKKRRSETVEFV